MDVCEYFKDRDTDIDEAELRDWICDRLKEEDLIGFTVGFIIAKLIEEGFVSVTSIRAVPYCYRTFRFIKIEGELKNGKQIF